jgi:hypothetical protein
MYDATTRAVYAELFKTAEIVVPVRLAAALQLIKEKYGA